MDLAEVIVQGDWVRKPDSDAAVVFVHGILSSGETCWKHQNGSYWPELLKQTDAANGWGIYVYSYQTGFFSGTYSLNDVVDDLKERFLNLDHLAKHRRIVFVCHSMGGIVARKFLVERVNDLLDRNIEVGFFLVASPSMGSDYANWLAPLAKLLGHTQADALRFTQQNSWLNGLDKEFRNLKESGRLQLVGKELIEDKFVLLPGLLRKQVVEPFAGARNFGEPYKVPGSDHFSIAKPADAQAVQHRLLLAFLEKFAPRPLSSTDTQDQPTDASNTSKQIFISYRHTKPDEDLALELEKALVADGQQVFVDRRMLLGTDWATEIDRRLRAADIFIVLLSADSIRSDMVRQEIMLAHQLRQLGKLRILPVRIRFTGALPYDLGGYLNPLQYAVWTGEHATSDVVASIKQAIRQNTNLPQAGHIADEPDGADQIRKLHAITEECGAPLPQVDPRLLELALEKGAMRLDSQFYLRRQADQNIERFLSRTGTTVIVKGARQMGKSSLLVRAAVQAKNQGKRVCSIDFQAIDEARLATLDNLLLYLTIRMARDLKTPRKPSDYWDDNLGSKDCATDFIEDAVLADQDSEVILFLDEADRVFQYGYRNDFFGLLRSWTTRRAYKPDWERFSLVIAHSTDPVLWIDDITQSPFNVGDAVNLEDFSRAQLLELSQRYGLNLAGNEINELHALIGGQPYLSRQALYEIVTKGWDSFRENAPRSNGPFGDHLRRLVSVISQREALRTAVLQILQDKPCDDEAAFQRLVAAGVVKGETRHDARLRCHLYEAYFRQHL
ncbi:alpha/beta fold hydrolase [Methylomonas sp. EFPC3]|uniref:alpha/beta fold hydrolase n=1 Tax=Methylomonas sp. EFPC3 TaxID=3021710 RepID=UPI002415D0C6|nr:alpha/beta fold hydrolase [Methylomonas sp. EFPC3]WFP51966.1 alpha/beta fold hydrolase [Methylomonas sp. EFPC3]